MYNHQSNSLNMLSNDSVFGKESYTSEHQQLNVGEQIYEFTSI